MHSCDPNWTDGSDSVRNSLTFAVEQKRKLQDGGSEVVALGDGKLPLYELRTIQSLAKHVIFVFLGIFEWYCWEDSWVMNQNLGSSLSGGSQVRDCLMTQRNVVIMLSFFHLIERQSSKTFVQTGFHFHAKFTNKEAPRYFGNHILLIWGLSIDPDSWENGRRRDFTVRLWLLANWSLLLFLCAPSYLGDCIAGWIIDHCVPDTSTSPQAMGSVSSNIVGVEFGRYLVRYLHCPSIPHGPSRYRTSTGSWQYSYLHCHWVCNDLYILGCESVLYGVIRLLSHDSTIRKKRMSSKNLDWALRVHLCDWSTLINLHVGRIPGILQSGQGHTHLFHATLSEQLLVRQDCTMPTWGPRLASVSCNGDFCHEYHGGWHYMYLACLLDSQEAATTQFATFVRWNATFPTGIPSETYADHFTASDLLHSSLSEWYHCQFFFVADGIFVWRRHYKQCGRPTACQQSSGSSLIVGLFTFVPIAGIMEFDHIHPAKLHCLERNVQIERKSVGLATSYPGPIFDGISTS